MSFSFRLFKRVAALLCAPMFVVAHAQTPATFKALTDTTLMIREGSPLDFSRMLPAGVAGANGRVTIGPKGRLVFANSPNTPANLSCVSMVVSGATGGYPDKSTADLLARQIKLHGYNVVRLHFIEQMLMIGRTSDFDYDKTQLDRFYYFLAALKREGIYWLIDILSDENGAYGMPSRYVQKYNLKFLVQVDQTAMDHWKKMVDTLYVPKNPYTGISLLADPAMAGITMVNEGGMNYLAATRLAGWRPELKAPFNAWLKKTYSTDAELKAAWPDFAATESLASGTVNLPTVLRAYTPRMADFQNFLTELESSTANTMTSYLRSRGYVGPTTAYDNGAITQVDASRSALDWVDMHSYHDEVLAYAPGSKILQTSSIDDTARYARRMAVSRLAGKPFSVTEYGQPFWNKYRFESALVVPSMAALQGWDFACQHAEGGVDLSMYQQWSRKNAIYPYNVGMDPITRAAETVARLLYTRGDVAPSSHRLSVQYNKDSLFKANSTIYQDSTPEDIGLLAWVTGIEIAYPNKASTFASPMVVQPVAVSVLATGVTKTEVQKTLSYYDLGASLRLDLLRKAGYITAANRTNIAAGVYESDTQQLLVDRGNGRFVVNTPRTEAVTSNRVLTGFNLTAMKGVALNAPGLLSASALDDLPLAQSKKILLVVAGDAQNTGMTFGDADRKQLLSMGTVPVMLQSLTAKASLTLSHSTPMKLSALTLNGDVKASVPITQSGATTTFTLDTGANPTTFFLLEAK